jgi:alanyl-tRNA synthetase
MTSAEIRRSFIDFFAQKHGHTFVPSSPVVPHDDPTLLFTNAGMNQFKPLFLGQEKRAYSRAVNTQKCIRAGGKHNDLDDVGRSRRHHTFFEMLGNWSFGDYFKQGAIEMSWELLTKVWKLDPRILHVTCFEGDEKAGVPRDTEAAEIWRKVANWEQYGLKSDDHIHYFGAKDNFWEMGETGPCGPCTEINVDRRSPEEIDADRRAGRKAPVNGDDPRVMEIWNNVFIQYNRNADRSLTTLPAQHVDTGMGFERVSQVIQGKSDNYGIDLFEPIFQAVSNLTGQHYGGLFPENDLGDRSNESAELKRDIAFRVIADHARLATFAITDGAKPDNKGRDSVVRSVIRRAVRFGYQQFGLRKPFLHTLVHTLADAMGDTFPELRANPKRVAQIIESEESSFLATIERGLGLFEEALAAQAGKQLAVVDARTVFDLHTTYGFPVDLQEQMAQERGVAIDKSGYDALFAEFQRKSGEGRKSHVVVAVDLTKVPTTDDSPKYRSRLVRAKVLAAVVGSDVRTSGRVTPAEGEVSLLLDRSAFYAEQGGQVGDSGFIGTATGAFIVSTTQRAAQHVLHVGSVNEGVIEIGQDADLDVDPLRELTQKNHTATHLLNWSLREVLGDDVQQKGSLVDPEKLRFDFSHGKAIESDELARIESLTQDAIRKDLRVDAQEAPQEQALKINGLRAVFGEKYPPMVRVVSIGASVNDLLANPADATWRGYSVEFCGGTHLASTGSIGACVITSEESVSKGIRRLVALTGEAAVQALEASRELESMLAAAKTLDESKLPETINALQRNAGAENIPLRAKRLVQASIPELQARYKAWHKAQAASSAASIDIEAVATSLLAQANKGVVVGRVDGATDDQLRSLLDSLKKRSPSVAVMLASVSGEKVSFVCGVSDDLIAKGLKAGDWIRETAKVAGGGGGGRPNMAQAGGKDPARVDEALNVARSFAASKI